MDVNVSAKNIKYGRREHGQSCPIALALKGMGFSRVFVTAEEVLIAEGKTCLQYAPSDRAADFIHRFDDHVDKKHFKPTSFRFGLRKKRPLDEAVREHGDFWKGW